MSKLKPIVSLIVFVVVVATSVETVHSQSVCLPAPRLLSTMPMGGQISTEFEVEIRGQNLDDIESLLFSSPEITAKPKISADGELVPNRFIVSIGGSCDVGVYDARVLSRLGISSARAFSVGRLKELVRTKVNTSIESAMPVEVNSICNATLTSRAIDHYRFNAPNGQRLIIDCAAQGIDSRVNPVIVIADSRGNDLQVERRGGAIDFTVPVDGTYVIKVHDLTYKGGPDYFYRLSLRGVAKDSKVKRLPSVQSVSSFSWPPTGIPENAVDTEIEPNNRHSDAQRITIPADLSGSFFPAADVDTYEFTAKKGETWWVEVASQRLGHPTDPSVIVQKVTAGEGKEEQLIDIAELTDIASPVKRSSNGYSYDGPPYDAGSSDVLGKFEVKEDGVYRLQITDLFGGTRNAPENQYRMIIRRPKPDFAIVAWAMHMGLRNGDRNALSKPIALRGGATIPFEVVVVRRDGFDGEIELELSNLPDGVTATGLKIGKGKTVGTMLVKANQDAPRGLTWASLTGRATIDDASVERTCRIASMRWPVTNARNDIPAPRLLASIPVSVGGSEYSAITIRPIEDRVWEAVEGEILEIPLTKKVRGQFSGANISMQTFGSGFERNAKFDVSLNEKPSVGIIDLKRLKTKPGEYVVAFYGGAVEKYRYNPDAVLRAEDAFQQAQRVLSEVTAEQKESATAALAAAKKILATVKKKAAPKDIVDIYVSDPINIRVLPATKK